MKKSILIVLLVALLAVAVGVSGCLGGDDNTPDNNSTNGSTNGTDNSSNGSNTNGSNTNGTDNSSNGTNTNGTNNSSNVTPELAFNNSSVIVSSLPSGYELLAVRNVTADNENIDGINDALNGFSGYYSVNSTNVYLSAFQTKNDSAAKGYVQAMIDANKAKYPESSNVTTITIHDHDATLITTPTTAGGSTIERYTLAWANGDKLVVVNGPATLDEIKTIAEASDL
ncbi:hypothetical protein MmiEs2_10890 [Methanimicrococcus stummii]|uniref:DUF4367 domain-containing protein n=1 Tax=Methanimicrococcus stummii TaxID=3028294 RepID=A0AA96VIE4_9EURY|nr:hypothetical protein [Methanimicrococcus sp. Es2]WNY28876.1 hypothetical protein MmiEs2_10890 [Methanimicrococcus sp. Es2]